MDQGLRPAEKQSYQFRALSRKTLSFQKRQCFTNCCCVACCPFLMVAICGILSIALTGLINSLNEVNYYTYCSNATATDYTTGFPISNGAPSETFIDEKDKEQTRYFVNFYENFAQCVEWYSQDYPYQFPYSPGPTEYNCSAFYNPELCPNTKISTTSSQPINGWFPDFLTNSKTAGITFANLFNKQIGFWGWVASAQAALEYGSLPRENPVRLLQPVSPPTPVVKTGLLGAMEQGYFTLNNMPDFKTGSISFEKRPYYVTVDSEGNYETIDEAMIDLINSVLKEIEDAALEDDADIYAKQNYTLKVQESIAKLPHSILLIDEISNTRLDYTLQVGTNRRLSFLSEGVPGEDDYDPEDVLTLPTFPSEGKRRLLQQSKLSQAYLKSTHPQLQNYTIVQGTRIMPVRDSTQFTLPIGSFVGEILYPFGVSFLLPVFVVTLVKEKEDRILMMMKMNGMKTWAYYLTHYVHFYILHILSTAVFIITGVIFRLEFFTLTDPGAYILFFFIWGNTQIALAFVFATLFNRSRPALLLVFCVVLAGVIINIAIGSLFTQRAPIGYLVWPPFAFYRGISTMNKRSFDVAIPDYTMKMMVYGDEVFDCLIALILSTIILYCLAAYLAFVLPSEYGIQKPWYFVFTEPYFYLVGSSKKNEQADEKEKEKSVEIDVDESELLAEDEDVKDERTRVYASQYNPQSPVVMKDMRKQFTADKIAVKSVSLAIDPNSVFGLLGPNGAGKTTLINILTGLYPPSSGDSRLAGYKVGEEMREIYMNIGVCPQHDILWDDLTVEEHLLFYARIKGVNPKEESSALAKALETVSLTNFKTRLSKGLSGGEKRRLSIAISLIGDPKVVFLDEPTTGLDPEVRRLIWDIVNRARNGRTIILTTHSMEEAEVLCQKIGIMAKGTLRCLGPQVRLKNKYGSGFKISFSCDPKDHTRICEYVESLLPSGWKQIDNFAGSASYEFNGDVKISSLFKEIEEHKEEYGIQFWGISQTSLEEVFLRIIKEADAEAY